ncbi:MAG: winged helix-turn-helix transcriptional regulator [Planctomycetota bacterium]
MTPADRAPRSLSLLCHYRWSVPVLDALQRGTSMGRVAPLLQLLGVTRPSLHRTIDGLVDRGLVRWNPGYGHPLRPELLLSDCGREVGRWCTRMLALADRAGARDLVLRKWALACLAALHAGKQRFGELQHALDGVTARALNQALRQLIEEGMLARVVYDDVPPSVRYRLTAGGRKLARAAILVPDVDPAPPNDP